ncbi:MAG: ParB N-terminal domain-containing protein [Spirochaetes bacterium]|uniref:ParB N-terminal domain-containing protein n=1 Tax=Candidatus Gallitreponema excrementavium TaxID=2840840 RepID=A0A9D9HNJ3_9SPIR|nr:ParB N-terminal domain-containing protein [Candidatus Gallitreponema excrementavium]
MLVQVKDVIVKKRIRKELQDIQALKESMSRYGLMNPITINSNNELIAGHRRLEAAKELGWNSISAVVIDPKNEILELEMELEENIQRSPFTKDELIEGYERLEKLRHPGFFRRIWNFIVNFFKRLFSK